MNFFTEFLKRKEDGRLYILLAACALMLSFVGEQGEPYPLALFFAMLACGLNIPLSLLLFLCGGILSLSPVKWTVYVLIGAFLTVAFALFRRYGGKNQFLTVFFLLPPLLAIYFLFPLAEYPVFAFLPPLAQKGIFCALLFFLSLLFRAALKALTDKLLRCRLSREELVYVFCFAFFVLYGLYRLGGETVYCALSLFLILLALPLLDAPAVLTFAVLIALPYSLATFSLQPVANFALIAGMGAFFYPSGKLPTVLFVSLGSLVRLFYDGLYDASPTIAILQISGFVLPCIAFLALPQKWIERLQRLLVFYRGNQLGRKAINRNRAAIGERLFALSAVFRRIENSFNAISDEKENEDVALLMQQNVIRDVCIGCTSFACKQNAPPLRRLTEIGCAKGKVSLMDLPDPLGAVCPHADGIVLCMNSQLQEYRTHQLAEENADMGRRLLASQAKGVSELLKNIAIRESRPVTESCEREKALYDELAKNGILCSEILLYGEEEDIRVHILLYGRCETALLLAAAAKTLHLPMILSEKTLIADEKYCYTLCKKPKLDAAFGVATRHKQNKLGNGDTHSVIRIDEKRFLAALSDGMGSGTSAEKISQTAISLLESFYRAGMPRDVILTTVNKLLAFQREERFVCLDIASVDLETGKAEIVKVASPLSFIFSRDNIRVLEGDSLPLGMLEEVHPTTFSLQLQPDDLLIFLSDGITDAFPSSTDLLDFLKKLTPLNPQALAERILNAALQRTDGTATDDMTVLAVRLFSA